MRKLGKMNSTLKSGNLQGPLKAGTWWWRCWMAIFYNGWLNAGCKKISFEAVLVWKRKISWRPAIVGSNWRPAGRQGYYSPVRIKPAKGNDFVEALLQQGIAYLELRMIDLNPLCKNGISIETMQFIHLFLILMLFLENKPFGGATFCGVDMIIQDIEGCHRHQLLHYWN